jgi:hypothetical protein
VDDGATRPAWTAAGPGSSPTGAAQ